MENDLSAKEDGQIHKIEQKLMKKKDIIFHIVKE